MFKRTTRTILATTALAAGLLGSVPLAQAAIGVQGKGGDIIAVSPVFEMRKAGGQLFLPGPGGSASGLDLPPGPNGS